MQSTALMAYGAVRSIRFLGRFFQDGCFAASLLEFVTSTQSRWFTMRSNS